MNPENNTQELSMTNSSNLRMNKSDMDENVLEKINEFYKLKHEYETKIQTQKNSILKNDTLNRKQKQEKYRKLNSRCINCGRNVGSIFEKDGNMLTAICGDRTKPCNLNIQIQRGAYLNLEELMDVFQNGVNDLKEEIIVSKLDLLFGYEKENKTLEKFNKLKNDLANDLESVMEYKTQYIEILFNLDNKPELNAKISAFYNKVSLVKSTIEEFSETGKIQLIKDMIIQYDTEMLPLLDEIRNLKYKYMAMESDYGTIKLIRKTFTLQDMMYIMETPKIESFVIG